MLRVLILSSFLLSSCAEGVVTPAGTSDASSNAATDDGMIEAAMVDSTNDAVDASQDMVSGGSTPDSGQVDASVVDSGSLDTGVDPVDTGIDPVDTGVDPGCSSDTMCDNGNDCDGAERCVAGDCVAGTPVVCSDDVSCTVDRCIPTTGECAFEPDDSRCGGGFVCEATGCIDPTCPESPCRLIGPQCGCPEGMGCYLAVTNVRVCEPRGTSLEGESCSSTGTCAPGNVCVNLTVDGGSAICRRHCADDADCVGGSGSLCINRIGALEETICTVHCDPVTSAGCAPNSKCALVNTTSGRRLTNCFEERPGSQGDTCTGPTDCESGFACVNTSESGTVCLATCRRANPVGTECDAFPGTTCVPLGEAPGLVLDGTEYGACL